MTDRYAVFGNPVAHSKSPQIHSMFAKQFDLDIDYTAELLEIDDFQTQAKLFFQNGLKGANVTVPFKLDAMAFAKSSDGVSERAAKAGAVNTLMPTDSGIVGDNTDGIGIICDITQNIGFDINGKQVLVLGAGGAVRGIMQPLMKCKPKHVVIANRSAPRAMVLANDFGACGHGFPDIKALPFDLIINGTSASLSGDVPPIPLETVAEHTCVYDMMYSAEPTSFLKWASENSNHLFDGLGMLVEQAAASFELWTGHKPQTQPVIQTLRDQLSEA